jgi:hypothetical protein
VLPKLAAQLPELRIRLFQALEAENFRLRQLETIILRKDDA